MMITDYTAGDTRNKTGIVFGSMLDSIEELKTLGAQVRNKIPDDYDYGDILAGEFAIACLQSVLNGENSSDNPMVKIALTPTLPNIEKSRDSYYDKVAKSESDMRLEEIAEYRNEGLSYAQIERETGIPRTTVQYRMKLIKRNHPDWLLNE